ncbi:Integrin beta-PS [Zootermopsis nevadensis]|uniref:Integrin beta-PS n=2 Tax=Zootermopsis nevadensis TaxID=136037 RepID=A0A067REL8_ZOONE|nr:Integrin beta-PS [Zootermopsis nevadensis]
MCEHLFPCVLCQVHETDSLNPEQCANCTELIIEEVDDLFEEEGTNCVQFYGECRSEYQYLYNETSGIIIRTLRSLKCPLQLSFTPIIVAIIAFILALGIIALCIWKYITVRKDQLEFIKFKNEQAKAEWDVAASPLYIPPVTTFKNPTYNAVS